MDRLARQEARLKKIEEQLFRSSQETRQLERQIQRLNQQKRYRKLIEAGLLFEEAGILDHYDPDAVLIFLKQLRAPQEKGDKNG